jgi:hypothetical protein
VPFGRQPSRPERLKPPLRQRKAPPERRFASPGGASPAPVGRPVHDPSSRLGSAEPAAPARAGPLGAGRHHVSDAAISIAVARGRPACTEPCLRRPSVTTAANPPGTRPCRTRRRRPTSRLRCRDFNRRGARPAYLHRTLPSVTTAANPPGTRPCRTRRRRPTSRLRCRDFNRRGARPAYLHRTLPATPLRHDRRGQAAASDAAAPHPAALRSLTSSDVSPYSGGVGTPSRFSIR